MESCDDAAADIARDRDLRSLASCLRHMKRAPIARSKNLRSCQRAPSEACSRQAQQIRDRARAFQDAQRLPSHRTSPFLA